MQSLNALDVLDRAYSVHQPTEDWLRGVADAVCAVADRGAGLLAFALRSANASSIEFAWPTPARIPDYWHEWYAEMCETPSELQRYARQTPALTYKSHFTSAAIAAVPAFQMYIDRTNREALANPPRTARELIERDVARGVPWAECMALHASDATDQDLFFVLPCPRLQKLPALAEVEHWSRVMAHVANAWRLHRQLSALGQRALVGADVVLSPSGAVLDAATPESKAPVALDQLRAATEELERSRAGGAKSASPPERLLAERLALVAGRWSLVDEYDTDGKRFVVARRNDEGATVAALSDRQRQIAAHLARGNSSKLIAYQLGISLSTVTTHVRRLASKFKSENRVQLVAACQMFLAFEPASEAPDRRA